MGRRAGEERGEGILGKWFMCEEEGDRWRSWWEGEVVDDCGGGSREMLVVERIARAVVLLGSVSERSCFEKWVATSSPNRRRPRPSGTFPRRGWILSQVRVSDALWGLLVAVVSCLCSMGEDSRPGGYRL